MWGPASEKVIIKEALQLSFNSWWDFQVFKSIQYKLTATVGQINFHQDHDVRISHCCPCWCWWFVGIGDLLVLVICGICAGFQIFERDMQSVCRKSKESRNQIFLRNMKTRSSCGLAEYLLFLTYFHQNEMILEGHIVCRSGSRHRALTWRKNKSFIQTPSLQYLTLISWWTSGSDWLGKILSASQLCLGEWRSSQLHFCSF